MEKLPSLFFLTGLFWCSILARSILSPLLPALEASFSLTHTVSSRLFLIMGAGYSLSMLFSGVIACRFNHRQMIFLSLFVTGGALCWMGFLPQWEIFYPAVFLLGAGAGLYSPSGITVVASMLLPRHWQKGMAFHELGPHLAMLAAPLFVNLYLPAGGWQGVLQLAGVFIMGAAFLFLFRFREGEERGAPPSYHRLTGLLKRREFWIMALLFSFALASAQGIYLLIPTFLVNEAGITLHTANRLFGLSRFVPIPVLLSAGMVLDRLDLKKLLVFITAGSGVTILLLGLVRGPLLLALVFLQPAVGALFFPAGMTVLAGLAVPEERNLVAALVFPVAGFIGTGLLPNFLGFMGDFRSFAAGFALVGAAALTAALLPLLLRFEDGGGESGSAEVKG